MSETESLFDIGILGKQDFGSDFLRICPLLGDLKAGSGYVQAVAFWCRHYQNVLEHIQSFPNGH